MIKIKRDIKSISLLLYVGLEITTTSVSATEIFCGSTASKVVTSTEVTTSEIVSASSKVISAAETTTEVTTTFLCNLRCLVALLSIILLMLLYRLGSVEKFKCFLFLITFIEFHIIFRYVKITFNQELH